MKIHRTCIEGVKQALADIFVEGYKADKVLQRVLRSNRQWGSRDRAFIASYTYDIVRWWRMLHHINGTNSSDTGDNVLYQLIATQIVLNGVEDQYNPLSGLIDTGLVKRSVSRKTEWPRAVRHSIPDWLDEIGNELLGSSWEEEIGAMNQEAKVALRPNLLKTTGAQLVQALLAEGIEIYPIQGVENAYYLDERSNVFATKAFKQGLFEIQDPGSQLIGQFLNVTPGMRVIDACAGAGGKSLMLSGLMNGQGTIIAMDVSEPKLQELKKRAKRNGAHNIDPRHIQNSKAIKRLHDSADRVLLDVPCSGTGVLRRNPDAKWKLGIAFVTEIIDIQKDILQRYSKMVKVGGQVVYATCSILPIENEQQVQFFLKDNDEFELAEQRWTSPFKDGFDGFYMARLVRVK